MGDSMSSRATAYRVIFDQFLVRTDSEKAHHQAFAAIRAAKPVLARVPFPGSPVEAMGLTFPNALGLAAGFDKNGVGIDALGGLGFGHVEIGTVTAQPQPGNPKPRLFRLPTDRAVVNRMGFNNDGALAVADRLAARAANLPAGPRPVLGINIGKTKVVPDDDQSAVEADYAFSATHLAPYADYLVVNVSSPNTPGLRSLQAVGRLGPLLEVVRRTSVESAGRIVPLLVKIAPDLADEDVVAVADLALELGLEGIVATNTTIARDGLRAHPSDIDLIGAGGLSGAPLKARSLEVIKLLRKHVDDRLTLIGVGGISTLDDARERLEAGADLLQAYTAFIYEGPAWARSVNAGLV